MTLRCRNVAELASDYLDGSVSWHRRLAVQLHLLFCRICRRYVGQMRQTVHVLRSSGKGEAPPSHDQARSLFRSSRK